MNSKTDIADLIDREIDAAHDALFALCGRFIAAYSVNPPGNTSAMADVVRAYLDGAGIPNETISADYVAPNVVGRVTGTRIGKHVVFNAHMDTMEAGDETVWSVPPYAMSHRGDRLYGLGMGNMKGALAAMCLATSVLHRHRAMLAGRVSLTAVSDEVMFGDRGTVFLLDQRPDLAGDFLISGEGPGFMDLAVAEKGLLWLDIEATGSGGHSSGALRGQTAVMVLVKFLTTLDPLNDLYAEVPAELHGVTGGDGNLGLRVSLNAGTIAAGTVRSQIAPRATAQLDIRLPPGITAKEIEDRIRAIAAPLAQIRIATVKSWDANWVALDNPLTAELIAAATHVRGSAPRLVVRLPGSDARRWRDLGVPALCYGPQPTLSSGIDDYALAHDIVDCAKIYARTALRLMAS